MTSSDQKLRFDELSAGRAMGDLCLEEEHELVLLGKQLGIGSDLAFELLAASIEVEFLQTSCAPLPASLVERLHLCADELSMAAVVITPQIPAWQRFIRNPLIGWAAAAAIAIIAVISSQRAPQISPVRAEAKLRGEARDLIERKFAGRGTFTAAGGKVVWSDQLQKGYMTLTGIPANDPKKAQYQLWIVDPKRDEAPVDGGVFDIPTDGSPVVVPITAKLALTNPQLFVITVEQPGGVVKSKQQQVVALAKS